MGAVYSATTEGEEALTATTETVLALIGSATTKARIIEWGVSFDGTNAAADPVRVRILRTTADDGTSTGAVEKPWDPDSPAANCAAKHSYTAEPTKEAQALVELEVPPTSGVMVQYPLGREIVVDSSATAGLVIECSPGAAVNCEAYIVWEE